MTTSISASPADDADESGGPGRSALLDPARLTALVELGLSSRSDPGMERYAERVRDQIGVPVSLVSLVQADQQVFPGMCGLPDPWASRRATPLSHSFCQHVIATGDPLVIEDARLESLLRENLATLEIGVVAYAGMPLTDSAGLVLGSLCAIDTEPRVWTERELAILRDTALDCSTELRLRLSRFDADRERTRRDAIDAQLQAALQRSQQLLAVAEVLNTCASILDVRQALASFADPSVGLLDVAVRHPDDLPGLADPDRFVVVEDVDLDDSGLDRLERDALRARGARAVAYLPVRGSGPSLGCIELLWSSPQRLDPQERAMAAALAAYTGQALERANLIETRIQVAHELQNAQLADLPVGTGLEIAACYLPAMAEHEVGGDWYDAFAMPGTPADSVHVSVGDITGHDIAAAAVMGQARAMLRQAAWDRPGAPPSEHVAALEAACEAFDIPASGTAVLARLTPAADSHWTFTWVNAGHPAPLVIEPDGRARFLDVHDLLFGFPGLRDRPRTDHTIDLSPGCTVVLHTDGLTDDSSAEHDVQLQALLDVVTRTHTTGAAAVVEALADRFDDMSDDVVALVVRVPPVAPR